MFKPVLTSILIFWMAVSVAIASPVSDSEALFEAARQGELEKVRALLQQGLEVNGRSRYGATALSFACDKGHLEVVRLLLDQGAEVNVRDSFYNVTPLGWSLQNGHFPIALLLLERGAEDAPAALAFGVRRRNPELIRAALASGKLDSRSFSQSLKLAQQMKVEEIVAILEAVDQSSLPSPQVDISPQQMQSFQGAYRDPDGKLTLRVALDQGRLKASLQGESEDASWSLQPVGPNEFEAEGEEDVTVTFAGRSGITERAFLRRGQRTQHLPRLDESESAAAPLAVEADHQPAEPVRRSAPQNWPAFRGPNASGIADGQGAPLSWNAEDSTNILWKTPIPGLGNSSPVIWGDRVFLTAAVSSSGNKFFRTGLYGDVAPVEDDAEQAWTIYCLDRKTGKIRWQRKAGNRAPRVKRHPKSTHANPTPVTDGRRVIALLPDLGLFAYDLEGSLLWKSDLGFLDSGWFYDRSYQWGFASSPVLYKDLVIVQADIQDESFIAAYSVSSGEQVWKTARDSISTWSTPSLYTHGDRHQVIANGPRIQSYDPASGKELWSLGPSSEVVVGTPVVGQDLIYLTAGYPPVRPIYAVRPGASGDISLAKGQRSNAHIAWSYDRGGTYIPSPILYRGYFYTNANDGRLTCYDAKTGKRIYRARIGGKSISFVASPLAADGRLYFSSEKGEVFVVKAGPRYEELSVNPLGESVLATPAISDGVLVIRGLSHVYGIGEVSRRDAEAQREEEEEEEEERAEDRGARSKVHIF